MNVMKKILVSALMFSMMNLYFPVAGLAGNEPGVTQVPVESSSSYWAKPVKVTDYNRSWISRNKWWVIGVLAVVAGGAAVASSDDSSSSSSSSGDQVPTSATGDVTIHWK
jgi:hypothetical protein